MSDIETPEFGASEFSQGLAQALLEISTALTHGEAGKSVRGGVVTRLPENVSSEALAHRAAIEEALEFKTEKVQEFNQAVKAEDVSEANVKPEPL